MSFDTEKNYCILGFPESQEDASELAKLLDFPYATIAIHRFPDGESKVTLPAKLLKSHSRPIIFRSLDRPNEKLIELILAADGAKQLGAVSLTLIAPYLAYMRQDKAFNPGEVVSQKIIGDLLASRFDAVLTIDSHLHRILKLSQAIPTTLAINLSATHPMAAFLKAQLDQPFLLGPDEESQQWVEAIAQHDRMDFAIASKQRKGDREVVIELPVANYQGRDVVLVDDMASSGQTLIQAARELKRYKPKSISVLVTHALFKDGSVAQLQAEGVTNIWSCNSVNHASNALSLIPLLAENIKCSLTQATGV